MIYKMSSHHYSQKDSHTATQFFVNATDENDLYEQVKDALYWDDREDEDGVNYVNDIIRLKGDNDEEVTEFCDLYYGLTTFSWEECPNLSDNDWESLYRAGMTEIAR